MRRAMDGILEIIRSSVPARGRRAPLVLALLLTGLLTAGCGSTPKPRPIKPSTDLHHPDPSLRALAVQDLATRGDRSYLADMIELLDDRDESVRLVASGALTSLTGRESGYQAFAPRAERLAERDAWRAWYEQDASALGTQP